MALGLVPPVTAAGPESGSKLEPALERAIAARPDARYPVIIARQPPRSRSEAAAQEDEVARAIEGQGGKVRGRLGLVSAHATTLTGRQITALARHPRVASVSLDHKIALQQVSTAPILQSKNLFEVNALPAWLYGAWGQGVTVAVLDSGINASGDLLNAQFGTDTVTGTTQLGDNGGHGTHVAGIVAGVGALSGHAYMGVAPAARLLSVKVTTDDGRASYSSIIKGLQWIVAHKDADNIRVANLSLGARQIASYKDDPLDAAVEAAWFRGIAVVASAGNEGPGAGTISVPGNDPYVITVGAVDDNQTASTSDDLIPDWTSRGPTAYDGLNKPDLAAPGRRVVSIRVAGSFLDRLLPERVTATNYFRLSGTSMAAPAVSGVVALMLSKNPYLRPNQIKAILTQTARPVAGAAASSVGAGLVDANAAVQLAQNPLGLRANVGLTPSSRLAQAIWPVLKTMQPKWRHTGSWSGRYWVDGGWDASGFRNANGTWNDGGWDATAWENFRWEDGGWDMASWADGGWDVATWTDGGWDDGSWDDGDWEDGSWDSAIWSAALPD